MLKAVRWFGYTQSLKCISLPVWKGRRAGWIQSYWCFTMGKVGEGNGNPLQHSCLKNPMDRGGRLATVMGLQRVGCDWATEHTHYGQGGSPCTSHSGYVFCSPGPQHLAQHPHTVGWRKGLLSEWLHISSTGIYEIIVNYGLSPVQYILTSTPLLIMPAWKPFLSL